MRKYQKISKRMKQNNYKKNSNLYEKKVINLREKKPHFKSLKFMTNTFYKKKVAKL